MRTAVNVDVTRTFRLHHDEVELVRTFTEHDVLGAGVCQLLDAAEEDHAHKPPIFKMNFHCSSVTGWTESREYFTSTMSFSFGSAFTAARVTGLGTSLTAFTSTRPKRPVSSVGSLRYSPITSTMPTIRFSSPV